MSTIELRFAVAGRARFLSHLECVDVLLAAFRRAGLEVALSNGIRPRPVISLAVARGVGVAAEDEIATVRLVADVPPEEVVERLATTLPRGLAIRSAQTSGGRPDPVAARYRIAIAAPAAALEQAAAAFAVAGEALVERRSPKGTKTVDVKRFASTVDVVDGGIEADVAISQEGSARPEEVVHALEAIAGRAFPVTGTTRIKLRVARSLTAAGVHGENA